MFCKCIDCEDAQNESIEVTAVVPGAEDDSWQSDVVPTTRGSLTSVDGMRYRPSSVAAGERDPAIGRRGVTPGKTRQQSRALSATARRVKSSMLSDGVILPICVLGGPRFEDPGTEELVLDVAEKFKIFAGKVSIITGGQPGVQESFARALGEDFPNLFQLLPEGVESGYGVGKDVCVPRGTPPEEYKSIFAWVATCFITFEGGADVAELVSQAFERGSLIIPLGCTGYASSGNFGFPVEALDRPAHRASPKAWGLLSETPYDTPKVAQAVVSIVAQEVAARTEVPANGKFSEVDSNPMAQQEQGSERSTLKYADLSAEKLKGMKPIERKIAVAMAAKEEAGQSLRPMKSRMSTKSSKTSASRGASRSRSLA